MKIAIMISAALLGAGACKKTNSEGGGGGGKAVATKLPKLGLQIDIPGDIVNVGDAVMAEGNSIVGSDVGAMQVEIFKDPQTIDQAKDDAKMFNPKNVKEEKLADGWTLSFENTGSMGTNYWVTVRRDIGGKTYKCWVTGNTKGQADATLAACKTLRP